MCRLVGPRGRAWQILAIRWATAWRLHAQREFRSFAQAAGAVGRKETESECMTATTSATCHPERWVPAKRVMQGSRYRKQLPIPRFFAALRMTVLALVLVVTLLARGDEKFRAP